ncbi:GTPase family protein [Alloalcanivorax marinus]|uniref:GTPase family protein n=1 Tax=Alloalcanivorax marinus TaxID=1177169 RepID=UPI001931F68D|nr:GTPase [Alloalcanivorax marinus]MBL7252019.1 50S ribosome-binding GTPase [Alloalcanivorax marinus]
MDEHNATDLPDDNQDTQSDTQDIRHKREIREFIQREIKRIRTYTPKIGVFGVTGVGKSSLCNALFGREIAEVSDVAACTRNPQEVLVTDDEGGGLILVDVPGVGENLERDKEYIELYQRLAPELDLILWAIKADDRAYASSVQAYRTAIRPHEDKCPVVFVITQADKIEPCREWDVSRRQPSGQQKHNLEVKKQHIAREFDLAGTQLVAVSAEENYNLDLLVSTIVAVLPNDKKASLVREAKEENVSDETIAASETGILDYLAEKIGAGLFHVREFLNDFVVDTAARYGSRISKVVVAWIAGKRW